MLTHPLLGRAVVEGEGPCGRVNRGRACVRLLSPQRHPAADCFPQGTGPESQAGRETNVLVNSCVSRLTAGRNARRPRCTSGCRGPTSTATDCGLRGSSKENSQQCERKKRHVRDDCRVFTAFCARRWSCLLVLLTDERLVDILRGEELPRGVELRAMQRCWRQVGSNRLEKMRELLPYDPLQLVPTQHSPP